MLTSTMVLVKFVLGSMWQEEGLERVRQYWSDRSGNVEAVERLDYIKNKWEIWVK